MSATTSTESFAGAVSQIDAGVLNVGYVDAGPADGRARDRAGGRGRLRLGSADCRHRRSALAGALHRTAPEPFADAVLEVGGGS